MPAQVTALLAQQDIDYLVDLIDELTATLPYETVDKARRFFMDVRAKAVDMHAYLDDVAFATPKQMDAIDHWTKGVEKWRPRDL